MKKRFFYSAMAVFLSLFLLQSLCFAASDYLGGTFLGSLSKDAIYFVQVGPQGDIYVSGIMGDLSLSNVTGFKTDYNSSSDKLAYIAKFDKDLKTLKAFTYIGDTYSYPSAFKVADNGDVYILTPAFDLNLPSSVPGYNTQYKNSYRMLIKFDSNLQSVKGYTYLYDIADISTFNIAPNGDIVIAGAKLISANTIYNDDAFIGILSSDLTQLKFSYSYGGSAHDTINSVYIDPNNNIFVSGITASSDFPASQSGCLTNEPCSGTSTTKVFVSEFDMSLTPIKTVLITQSSNNLITGDSNNIYIATRSDSDLFVPNNTPGTYHPIILKLDYNLSKIEKSFPINYSKGDYIQTITCINNKLFIGGSVYNDGNMNFPFTPANVWHPTSYLYSVGMVMVLENDLATIDYATIIGGTSGADSVQALSFENNILYTAGYTQSSNFPVGSDGYQTSCVKTATGSCYDGFIVKFAPFNIQPVTTLSVDVTGNHVTMSWDNVDNYTGYTLYYVVYPYTGNEKIETIDLGNINSLSFDLWQGAAFYVAIMPYNANNDNGELSNVELIQIQ